MPEPNNPQEKRQMEARTPDNTADQPKKEKPGFAADCYSWLQALTFALVILIVVFTFFGRIIGVEGSSMVPTLEDGDMLLLRCVGYELAQGDIVVLRKDFAEIHNPIVKRVVAVGGQTVEIDYDTNTVYVDGQALDEPYLGEPMREPESPYEQGTYWEVPEGSIFVMGDNRNASSDSRHAELGVVDERHVLGKVLCVLLPFQHIGAVN